MTIQITGVSQTIQPQPEHSIPRVLREVTVALASHRPGVPAQVTVGYRVSATGDGGRGPFAPAGTAILTADTGAAAVRFLMPPETTQPLLTVCIWANWADGQTSGDLTEVGLAPCRQATVWWPGESPPACAPVHTEHALGIPA